MVLLSYQYIISTSLFFFLNRCTFKMAPTRVIYFNRPMLENIDGRWGWGIISLWSYFITVVLKWFNISTFRKTPVVVVNANFNAESAYIHVFTYVDLWVKTVLQRIICLECLIIFRLKMVAVKCPRKCLWWHRMWHVVTYS